MIVAIFGIPKVCESQALVSVHQVLHVRSADVFFQLAFVVGHLGWSESDSHLELSSIYVDLVAVCLASVDPVVAIVVAVVAIPVLVVVVVVVAVVSVDSFVAAVGPIVVGWRLV